MPEILLSEAIQQLRDQLRQSILEGKEQDILFTPNSIDIELGITFRAEARASGGAKLLAFIDLSAQGSITRESQHKIKISLSVADKAGQPIKVRSDAVRKGLPE